MPSFRSCAALRSRYRPYGIAVRKDRLFDYGGRPVLYGDDDLFNALPEELEYLWSAFQPVPNPDFGGYPLDWTHEREWRARPKECQYGRLGQSPEGGVPLLLPPDYDTAGKPTLVLPWLLVDRNSEAAELKDWVSNLPGYIGNNKVIKRYFDNLPKVPILPLEMVRERLKQGDSEWRRLDTLPIEQLQPDVTKELTQLGWRRLR